MGQQKQPLRPTICLHIDLALPLLSCCQDPRTLLSCIDFRYITDALTEEDALGEACWAVGPGTLGTTLGEGAPGSCQLCWINK